VHVNIYVVPDVLMGYKRPNGGRMKGQKVTAGPKPVRSDNVTMRFDPRLKYLASVVGRYERQTLSTVVEIAVDAYIKDFTRKHLSSLEDSYDMAAALWSPHEIVRFSLLADEMPELLTYEEEILWKLILEDRSLWKESPPGGVRNKMKFELLESKWEKLVKRAEFLASNEPSITVGSVGLSAKSDRNKNRGSKK
jgi:hypothetical protein